MSSAVPFELDILSSLRRHLVVAGLVFLAIIGLTVAVLVLAPRQYRSSAKIFLKIGRESVTVDPTAASVGDPLSVHLTREHEIQTALGIMQSREILAEVVKQIGAEPILAGSPASKEKKKPSLLGEFRAKVSNLVPDFDPIPVEESAIRNLENQLYLNAGKESSIVDLGYVADTPEMAQEVLRVWLDQYIGQHTLVHNDKKSLNFFETQRDKIKSDLETARDRLRSAKTQYGLVTIEGQQKLLEEQLALVMKQLSTTEAEIAASASRIQAYDQMLSSDVRPTIESEVSGKANEGRDVMRSLLFTLELEQKQLQSKLTPGHPKLDAIERQIIDAKEIVSQQSESRREITETANPAYQQLSAQRIQDNAIGQGLLEKKKSLSEQIDSLGKRFAELNQNEGKLASLIEDVRILDARYSKHVDRLEQARMNDVLSQSKITSVSVVQSPTLQFRPVSPNKPIVALGGIAAAIAAAIALPVWLDQRRRVRLGNGRSGYSSSGKDSWDFESRQQESEESAGTLVAKASLVGNR
jgi:polysaccharide biosynthesis protein PslE